MANSQFVEAILAKLDRLPVTICLSQCTSTLGRGSAAKAAPAVALLWQDPAPAYLAARATRENDVMANQSYIYLGLAGETGPGRVVDSGLFRLADGSEEWEPLRQGLPDMPAVRALAVHPERPEILYAGTQSGPYRSADRGEHWEKVELPDHGLPVWSILFHPHDPDVILVGCENCEIYRSDDAGEHWTRLPVAVRFPEITTAASIGRI